MVNLRNSKLVLVLFFLLVVSQACSNTAIEDASLGVNYKDQTQSTDQSVKTKIKDDPQQGKNEHSLQPINKSTQDGIENPSLVVDHKNQLESIEQSVKRGLVYTTNEGHKVQFSANKNSNLTAKVEHNLPDGFTCKEELPVVCDKRENLADLIQILNSGNSKNKLCLLEDGKKKFVHVGGLSLNGGNYYVNSADDSDDEGSSSNEYYYGSTYQDGRNWYVNFYKTGGYWKAAVTMRGDTENVDVVSDYSLTLSTNDLKNCSWDFHWKWFMWGKWADYIDITSSRSSIKSAKDSRYNARKANRQAKQDVINKEADRLRKEKQDLEDKYNREKQAYDNQQRIYEAEVARRAQLEKDKENKKNELKRLESEAVDGRAADAMKARKKDQIKKLKQEIEQLGNEIEASNARVLALAKDQEYKLDKMEETEDKLIAVNAALKEAETELNKVRGAESRNLERRKKLEKEVEQNVKQGKGYIEKGFFKKCWDGICYVSTAIYDAFVAVGHAIGTVVKLIIDGVKYVIKWTVDKIKELIEKVIKPKHAILIEK